MGFSDAMLQSGCAPHIEAAHGETITVLTGLAARKQFTAVIEEDKDAVLAEQMGITKDRRARKQMRFSFGSPVPSLPPTTVIKTADGRFWQVVDDPQTGTLSTDFQIVEGIGGKDSWAHA